MAVLTVVKADGSLETYPLRESRFAVGRDSENDLILVLQRRV